MSADLARAWDVIGGLGLCGLVFLVVVAVAGAVDWALKKLTGADILGPRSRRGGR